MTTFPRIKTASLEAVTGSSFAAFREVLRTGVIFVTTEAQRRGYAPASGEWCNLGQGMPESEDLPGAPPRITTLEVRDRMAFFRAALDRQVITVPGESFDVDPGKRRGSRASRSRRHLRFSFGPPLQHVELALERFKDLIATTT